MANIVQSTVELDLTVEETIGSASTPNVVSDARLKVTYSNINKAMRQKTTIAAGDADTFTQLAFGGVTNAHIVEMYSDEEVLVKLNNTDVANVAIPTRRLVLDGDTGITAIFVANDSGNEAHIDFYIAEKAS